MAIYSIRWLRKLVLPLLQRTAFDFTMAHPWDPAVKIRLNSFLHKGYWWHRKRREKLTMQLFSQLIRQGDEVAEVGGHIGFISTYFAALVGSNGKVFVFEPGSNNLPYIKKNISPHYAGVYADQIELIEAAVSDTDGVAVLHEDSLTGQNNSLVEDFAGLEGNRLNSYVETSVSMRKVETKTLDRYFNLTRGVDFIKIDIEGHEWSAVQGGVELISQYQPKMMIEIQAARHELFSFLSESGYVLFSDRLIVKNSPSELNGNIFCLHRVKHSDLIRELGL